MLMPGGGVNSGARGAGNHTVSHTEKKFRVEKESKNQRIILGSEGKAGEQMGEQTGSIKDETLH